MVHIAKETENPYKLLNFQMDTLKWRLRAKVVAVVQWVVVSITCVALALYIVCAIIWSPSEAIYKIENEVGIGDPSMLLLTEQLVFIIPKDPGAEPEAQLVWYNRIRRIALIVGPLVSGLEVMITWKLWVACKLNCELTTAAGNARIWRNARTAFLAISMLKWFSEPVRNSAIVVDLGVARVIYDLVGIGVVQKFINEIDRAVAARVNFVAATA